MFSKKETSGPNWHFERLHYIIFKYIVCIYLGMSDMFFKDTIRKQVFDPRLWWCGLSYHVEKLNYITFHQYILEAPWLSLIQPAQWFLGRSCQNELMRWNDFELKVTVCWCYKLEALAKNYYCCDRILKIPSCGQ